VSAVTEQPTPEWGPLQWDLTDPCSLRWAVLAPMAAQGWAALLQGWALFSTSLMIGKTQKLTSLASTMTVVERAPSWKKA